MPDNIKYSVDDTILDDPVIRKSIKVKGVTHFNRQENIKQLISQNLQAREKHLSIETFTENNINTFRVMLNNIEIGIIPHDELKLFLSPKYRYELTNIHLGEMEVEDGKVIYFARLYVTFYPIPPKKVTVDKVYCPVCGAENYSVLKMCTSCYSDLDVDVATKEKALDLLAKKTKQLHDVKEDNQIIKSTLNATERENDKLKMTVRSKVKFPIIFAVVASVIAILTFFVGQAVLINEKDKYNELTDDYEILKAESQNYSTSISVVDYTKYPLQDGAIKLKILGSKHCDYFFDISKEKGNYHEYIELSKTITSDSDGIAMYKALLPQTMSKGNYKIRVYSKHESLELPFTVQ